MTEYDLAMQQLADVLEATDRHAAHEHWTLVLDHAEEIKLLAQHLQTLHASSAPKAVTHHGS